MKILVLICRILLGLIFVGFGLLGVVHPIKPDHMPADALAWSMALYNSGWGRVLSAVQVVGGALVLAGFMLPLGMVLLCAETFNILCFHLFLLSGVGIVPGLVTAVLELVVLWAYRDAFRPLFLGKTALSV